MALLIRSPGMLVFHQTSHFTGHSSLEVICHVVVWAAQLPIIQNRKETVRKLLDWAGAAVWVMMLLVAVYLVARSGNFSFDAQIPEAVLQEATRAGVLCGADGGGRDIDHLLRRLASEFL